MLRPITDVEWAHIDDLLGSGPRPNVVGAWLWLTGRMEISRTTFESRLRVRRLTARSAGQAHAASAASTEEPDGAHGHACTAAQTPAPCPASEMPLSAVVREAQGLAPTEDDAGGGALGPELSTASELCEDDLAGQTEHSEVAAVLGPRAQSVYDRRVQSRSDRALPFAVPVNVMFVSCSRVPEMHKWSLLVIIILGFMLLLLLVGARKTRRAPIRSLTSIGALFTDYRASRAVALSPGPMGALALRRPASSLV